ncbi:hypothetical protein GIB67_018200 [Kingdonia uniflora]|uniref:Photosystem II 5 kDa protein, chloroplastic n=1 Tax=Kingdonia uniflora TaxID=39325 RepID=A0A7J7NMW1_9MAGN|nr:hypothetical protein GIB67_018200 [Kingdonia uniflora]
MASITMTATSFLGASNVSKQTQIASRRTLIVAKASSASEGEQMKKESNNGRRDMMFAAAAAALCSVAGVALADEPKRGTLEAKKKYATVCVTMPTARICRN